MRCHLNVDHAAVNDRQRSSADSNNPHPQSACAAACRRRTPTSRRCCMRTSASPALPSAGSSSVLQATWRAPRPAARSRTTTHATAACTLRASAWRTCGTWGTQCSPTSIPAASCAPVLPPNQTVSVCDSRLSRSTLSGRAVHPSVSSCSRGVVRWRSQTVAELQIADALLDTPAHRDSRVQARERAAGKPGALHRRLGRQDERAAR